MKLLEVNFSDLIGHAFNGYDLHIELIRKGIHAKQLVLDRRSDNESVKCLFKDQILHHQIREFEKKHSISNLLYPYGEEIINSFEFQQADLVHYHILHNGMVSLLDYPRLMNAKKKVWTIHDPWIVTGNCVHPLSCKKWKSGCGGCSRIDEIYFEMDMDNTDFMWRQKKAILSQVDPHIIVSCGFMQKYLKESPITSHFSNIHVIPFGIDTEKYFPEKRIHEKSKREIAADKVVIGFRADPARIKGSRYIYEALQKLALGQQIELLCVGNGHVPADIKEKYRTTELGWINDEAEMISFYQTCDIFLMPSLAESFGMMAVEAMAAGCTVISFQNTVLEEITNAPECGIAVEYLSSDVLAREIACLVNHQEEIRRRGKLGHAFVKDNYSFDMYVSRHIELFEEIMEEKV